MKRTKNRKVELLLVCCLIFFGILLSEYSLSFSQGPNNRNVSVDTRVNITGAAPEILNALVADPIVLSANGEELVTCNVTVQDFNGFGDIDTVNATFFFQPTSSPGAADDNNTHYTNTSCDIIPFQQSGQFSNYTCSFGVEYYAVNGTWNCTAEANDSISLVGTGSNTSDIEALLALNVTTLIDYGDMAMGDTSDNQTANITNIGNVNINVSLQGYGAAIGDNLSFDCEQGDLSVGLQKFAPNSTAAYVDKQNLTSTFQNIPYLTVNKTLNGTNFVNTTFWELYLNPAENAGGLCNGTIVFQAEASGQ